MRGPLSRRGDLTPKCEDILVRRAVAAVAAVVAASSSSPPPPASSSRAPALLEIVAATHAAAPSRRLIRAECERLSSSRRVAGRRRRAVGSSIVVTVAVVRAPRDVPPRCGRIVASSPLVAVVAILNLFWLYRGFSPTTAYRWFALALPSARRRRCRRRCYHRGLFPAFSPAVVIVTQRGALERAHARAGPERVGVPGLHRGREHGPSR